MLHSNKTENRIGLLTLTLIIFLTACSNYSMRLASVNLRDDNKESKNHVMAVVNVRNTETQEKQPIYFNKLRGGYGVSTPLYESDNQHMQMFLSKTKEEHWFTGIQFRYEF